MTLAMATSDKPLQPKLLTALTLVASGSDWDSAADAVGMTSNTLRRHFNHDPRATAFVERVVRENLNTANNVLANAAPRLADELVQIALDRKNKAYARTAAIGECFRIMNTNLIEQQQRKQMAQTQTAIRHCWCRARIRRFIGVWYQQHAWQSSRLVALNVPQYGRLICFTQGLLRP